MGSPFNLRRAIAAAIFLELALLAIVAAWWALLELADRAGAASSPDWYAVARCETGGDWHMRGPRFSGGVGFANTTWTLWARQLGLARRYPNAADAPARVQIRVAQHGWERGGYWGCL